MYNPYDNYNLLTQEVPPPLITVTDSTSSFGLDVVKLEQRDDKSEETRIYTNAGLEMEVREGEIIWNPYINTSTWSLTGTEIELKLVDPAQVFIKNKQKLDLQFEREKNKYLHYLKTDIAKVEEKTSRIITILANCLDFVNSAVEITPFNSCFFNFSLGDSKTLHVELYFQEVETGEDLFVAYYENKECIFSYLIKSDKLNKILAVIN
jgi:hypothetical protein